MQKTVKMNEFNFSARRTILSLFSRKELRALAKETGTKIGRDKNEHDSSGGEINMEKTINIHMGWPEQMTWLPHFTRDQLRQFARGAGIKVGRNKSDTIWNIINDSSHFAMKAKITIILEN